MPKESWRNAQSDLQRHTSRLLVLRFSKRVTKDIWPLINQFSANEVTRELLDMTAWGMRKMAIAGLARCDHFLTALTTAKRWTASTVRTPPCEGDAEIEAMVAAGTEAVFRDVLGYTLVLSAHVEETA